MMIGETSHGGATLHIPPWSFTADNPNSSSLSPNAAVDDYSLLFQTDSFTVAPQRYSPSSDYEKDAVQDPECDGDNFLPVDAYTCDQFRMFEFKVRMCSRARSHDWTECPFAHPGEKARRRDPRRFHYSGTACPEFRWGSCPQGDSCEYAHGVFECWLHPARYRTQPCKDGMSCTRRVCFFAHSADQLRVLTPRAESYNGLTRHVGFLASPKSESPPISPVAANSVDEMVASLRRVQLNKVMGTGPRVKMMTRQGYSSLPTTPTREITGAWVGYFDQCEEEGVMERAESGKDLRFRMFEKLSKEKPLDRVHLDLDSNPDVGWVSELVE